MAWTAPRTYVTGNLIDGTILNTDLRDNMSALELHGHGGGSGSGTAALGPLVHVTMVDAAAPGAPGGTLTRLFTSGSALQYRSGAGAVISLSLTTHTHDGL